MQDSIQVEYFANSISKETIIARIIAPHFQMIGARLRVSSHEEITGYVFQSFEVGSFNGLFPTIEGLTFQKGEYFAEIQVESGWEKFARHQISSFDLVKFEASSTEDVNQVIPEGMVWMGFRNVSNMQFGRYYLDLRGGETGGRGRNEHGPPHVHVVEFKTRRDLGKIFFPSVEDWSADGSNVIFEGEAIDRTMRKEIIAWMNDRDHLNLKFLNCEWDVRNKFNFRTRP